MINKVNKVNEPIAVIIDRNVESICCFMGIAMSRNFYVPIDVTSAPTTTFLITSLYNAHGAASSPYFKYE